MSGKWNIILRGKINAEKNQICSKNSNSYSCGLTSTKFLKEIIKNEKIECTYKNLDKYGRILGICGDINGKMIEFGHAVAYVKYSKKYLSLQKKAKNEKRGIWSGKFDMPEDWRRKNKWFIIIKWFEKQIFIY